MCWNTYISTAQICLLHGERKPLHTNFNYTLLPIQHVHATTTTVSTKSITRVRKIKTKRNAFVPRHKAPRRFDDVVNAVQKVLQNSHFDQGVQNVATPSLSLKTGHSLKKCINILRCHALRRKDKGLEEDVDKFEKLIAAEWSYHVSHHSLSALSTKKLTKLICCHLQKILRNS